MVDRNGRAIFQKTPQPATAASKSDVDTRYESSSSSTRTVATHFHARSKSVYRSAVYQTRGILQQKQREAEKVQLLIVKRVSIIDKKKAAPRTENATTTAVVLSAATNTATGLFACLRCAPIAVADAKYSRKTGSGIRVAPWLARRSHTTRTLREFLPCTQINLGRLLQSHIAIASSSSPCDK